jgi:hypothetical protein
MSVDRKCHPGSSCGALSLKVETERRETPVFDTGVKLNGTGVPQKINHVGIRS